MKIIIISAMFPPIRTGTSFYTKNIAESLYKNGYDITVITLCNKEATNDYYPFDVIRIPAFHFNVKGYFKHLRICTLYPGNFRKIRKIVKEKKAEIILLINHYLDIAFPAVYAAKTNKIPLIVSVGTQMQSLRPIRNKILNILDRMIPGNFIFPNCEKIISWDWEIHRYIQETQNKKNAQKSVIIPFGVNGSNELFLEHKHDYSQINQIIGVGAVTNQRDFIFNIKVFKQLLKVFPNLILKIAGHIYISKPLRLIAELELTEKVFFTGELPHEQVLEEYKKSALHWMMLTGRYVGLGTSNIEAMLMGLPVVTNAPANLFGESILIDMENYIFTDGQAANQTLKKLSKLLSDSTLREKIGKNGKEFVLAHLNWEIVSKQMINLFEISLENYKKKNRIEISNRLFFESSYKNIL